MTDTATPAGSLLSLPPPEVAPDRLAALLRRHWGREGALGVLTSERDLNRRLDSAEGSYTLKLANRAEPLALTRFQTEALQHVAAGAPGLPVPRVIPSQDGRAIVEVPEGALRLLTWLPGTPLAQVPRAPGLARSIGQALGRLDAVLQGFSHPASDHHLLWDIRNAQDLGPLAGAVPEDLRPAIDAVLARFAVDVAPALAALPRQVIHGDFNPHNLLADPDRPGELAGILDFGDMVLSHRVCDLAVAGSYLIEPDNPAALLVPLVQGYHAVNPLKDAELRLLPDLIAARLVTTLVISAWRAARYPANAAYILRNAPTSRAGLVALGEPGSLAETLFTACERPSR